MSLTDTMLQICARLPCDEPCGNLLECNHPCPSGILILSFSIAQQVLILSTVCGEKCQKQICVLCLAPDSEKRKDVVDLVMQRTLAEIDLSSTDVSERLITLDCRHTFTVETLDGHCSMQDYYEVDPMGTYLALKAPPVDYQLPPVCPTCRGAITAQRYGRVTKRAILDVLEQNVTATMSRALEQLNPELQRITTALTTLESNAKKITADPDGISDPSTNREEHAKGKITEPLPVSRLDRSAMHSVHGFSTNESQGWNALVGDLLKLYRQAHAIATKRGAHVQAYEAAVTTLFRLELRAIMENPDANGDLTGPEPRAMEAARKDVGQPPHKADSKFQVEAYHRTLELRFMLAQLAQCRLEGLQSTLTDDQVIKHRSLWESFIDFIYQSCEADAKKALSMAEMSSASRQVAHCSVYVIRSRFERERFQDITAEKKLPSINQPQGRTAREQLTNIVASQRRTISLELARMQNAYISSRPTRTTQDLRAEQAWYADNCHRKVDKYLKELDKLAEFIRKGGTYEALSVQEIEDIVKAFDFGESASF